jgi:4-aminobutyrate aminotransferase-like enzyme
MNDHSTHGSSAFWTRARRHLLNYGGSFVPFVPIRAEGCFLYDAGRRRVLDFTSGQMSAILGHSHPEIVATVRDAVGRLDHLFSSMLSEPVVDLAEALAELVPDLPRVMLLSTGGEANEAAGQAGNRQMGNRRIHPLLARHDCRRCGCHLQGRAARYRPAGARIIRHSGAQLIPPALFGGELAAGAG